MSQPASGSLLCPVIPRSPSHESFATDLSLMSLSSLGSARGRGPGPAAEEEPSRRSPLTVDCWRRAGPGRFLQVPSEHYGHLGKRSSVATDVLYEEDGGDAIRQCGAFSSLLGLMRSFSTGDLYQNVEEGEPLRPSVSETVLNSWKPYEVAYGRLEYTSRSCSTWVAVGDISTTSQLPSPQTFAVSEMTAVDFVRAINKKVRQMYIRRRLESTYRALERLTRSELSLDLPLVAVPVPQPGPQLLSLSASEPARAELQISAVGFHGANKTLSLTVKDIERDKGKPLSKYERNMMIFNWLQSLDENTFDQMT